MYLSAWIHADGVSETQYQDLLLVLDAIGVDRSMFPTFQYASLCTAGGRSRIVVPHHVCTLVVVQDHWAVRSNDAHAAPYRHHHADK